MGKVVSGHNAQVRALPFTRSFCEASVLRLLGYFEPDNVERSLTSVVEPPFRGLVRNLLPDVLRRCRAEPVGWAAYCIVPKIWRAVS
jgi:hypothetical protein